MVTGECRCIELPPIEQPGIPTTWRFECQIDGKIFYSYDRSEAKSDCEAHVETHPECAPCTCTAWVDAECVGDGLRRQIRTCTPEGCKSEERTVSDPACAVPVEFTLTLTVDKNSGFPGDVFNFTGYLRRDGEGAGGKVIEVYQQGQITPFATSVTNVDGRYTATWIAIERGTYYFQAYYKEEGLLSNQEVVVIEETVPGMGVLFVTARFNEEEVSAAVDVDGITKTTPFSIDLEPGSYTVTATYAEETKTETATITEGKVTSVKFQFGKPKIPWTWIVAGFAVLAGIVYAVRKRWVG